MLEVENLKSCRWTKFSLCHCKCKVPAHLKFSAQMPTFIMFEMKESFLKSVKYLWRYGIFIGRVYRLKVGNFKSCRWAKFSTCYCKSKIPAHLKFSAQMFTFNTYEMKQSFWKSVKSLQRSGIFAARIYRLKVGNFKSCRCAMFSPCHRKVKHRRTWNFRLQCPVSTRLRWSKVFENRLNRFRDLGFFAARI